MCGAGCTPDDWPSQSLVLTDPPHAAMQTLPMLLVAGASGVGKSTIITRLLAHSTASPAPPAQQQQPQSQQQRSWIIDTKYYAAKVTLQELAVPSMASGAMPADDTAYSAEALVLVADAQHGESVSAACAWADACPDTFEAAEVRLLVINKADLLSQQHQQQEAASGATSIPQPHSKQHTQQEPDRPSWLLSAMDWCTSRGVEYIEVCASDARLDAALLLDGEQQGMERVVHALQAHMWPGMQPKDRSRSAAEQATGLPSGKAEPSSQEASTAGGRASGSNPAVEPAEAAVAKASTSLGARTKQPQQQQAGQANGDSSDGDIDEADQVEAFDKMFAEIQGAKQRLAELPDDQRRSQAAAIALKLASMLGLDSDDDEGDDEDA